MDALYNLLIQSLVKVWSTFLHNWPFLVISILIAVLLKLYMNPEKVTAFLIRHQRAGVIGATVAAVGTPLCSCGTTAVLLGMMASMLPWAPIVAFMVASPLTSPQELIYSAGLFGWPFALAFFISSILLGLYAGLAASILERKGLLKNQSRFSGSKPVNKTLQPVSLDVAVNPCCQAAAPHPTPMITPARTNLMLADSTSLSGSILMQPAGGCCGTRLEPVPAPVDTPACGCSAETAHPNRKRFDKKSFLTETWKVTRQLLPMFIGFAFIGYFLNGLIPSEWVAKIFGSGSVFSVPLAAVLGLPLYINTEASLPLVSALIDNGMSQGAAMAFLITGAGTSIGALGGALTIARWRIVALVIGVLVTGAILMGYVYNALIAMGWV